MEHMEVCKDSIGIVDSIMEEILERQEQDRQEKLFAKVGKPYTSKTALQNTLCVMKYYNWDSVGDKHLEADMYDYEEEETEPKPPREGMIGLKIIKREQSLDYLNLDTDIDLDKTLMPPHMIK